MSNRTVEQRFWAKVDKTGECWLWTASLTTHGYGQFFPGNGRPVGAHRFSYELFSGAIPHGMDVEHRCRNRVCVNPFHLRLASRKQNMENLPVESTRSQSGVRGVSWHAQQQKWRATVTHNYRQHFVGCFDTIKDAAEAVRLKRIELFTHSDGR